MGFIIDFFTDITNTCVKECFGFIATSLGK